MGTHAYIPSISTSVKCGQSTKSSENLANYKFKQIRSLRLRNKNLNYRHDLHSCSWYFYYSCRSHLETKFYSPRLVWIFLNLEDSIILPPMSAVIIMLNELVYFVDAAMLPTNLCGNTSSIPIWVISMRASRIFNCFSLLRYEYRL